MREYVYGLDDFDQSKKSDVLKTVKEIKGICSVQIEDGKIFYSIDEWASEYDVMTEVMRVVESFGMQLNFDEEEKEEQEELPEELTNAVEIGEEEVVIAGGKKVKKQKQESGFTDFKQKGIELAIAIVFGVLHLVFTDEMVKYFLVMIAFTVSAYEIIYDAINYVSNKKFISAPLLTTLACLVTLICGNAFGAYIIAFTYTAVSWIAEGINRLTGGNFASYVWFKNGQVNKLEKDKEQPVALQDVKVGDKLVLRAGDKVAFDCMVEEGTADVKENLWDKKSQVITVEKDALITAGSAIESGEVVAVVKTLFKDTDFYSVYSRVEKSQEYKSQTIISVEKYATVFNVFVLVLALLVAFVPPIFGNLEFGELLPVWASRSVFVLLTADILPIVQCYIKVWFNAHVYCENNDIVVLDTQKAREACKTNLIFIEKSPVLSDGKFNLKTVYPASEEARVLGLINKATVNGITSTNYPVSLEENGKTITIGYKKQLEEKGIAALDVDDFGIVLHVAVGTDYIGCAVFTEEVKEDSIGAMAELRDLKVEQEVLLSSVSKEYTTKFRREMSMYNSFGELSNEQKLEKIKTLKGKDTAVYVGDLQPEEAYKITFGKIDSSTVVKITNGEISYLPFFFKIFKNASKLAKAGVVVCMMAKILSFALAFVGVSLYYAVGLFALASLITSILPFWGLKPAK